MDFNDTPEEAAFRKEVRTWLEANAQLKEGASSRRARDAEGAVAKAKEWQAKKADAGYAAITWPKEFGGRGGTPIQNVIYGQEESKFDVSANIFGIGLGMCIPTVLAHGTDGLKERYVQRALRGEEIWCQLFSEPSGGSDVAGLRTRAIKDGDTWTINGQKIWTTGAQYSDYGLLIARTNPEAAKHEGITAFIIDMKDPGVEVRPIKQASGGSEFNEVFFTDAKINDDHRLGEIGEGWRVAITTLMNERLSIGGGGATFDIKELMEIARNVEFEDGPAIKDGAVRERIADWYVQGQGLKYTRMRSLTALSRGERPGPENSIGKVVGGKRSQDMAFFGMELADQGGVLSDTEEGSPARAALETYLGMPGLRIAGGTDEILRNIIAERVLGLPADMRADKGIPFKDLPTGR